jgi:hypothetical protein
MSYTLIVAADISDIRERLGTLVTMNKTLEDSIPLLKKVGGTYDLLVRRELRVTRGFNSGI